MLGIRIRHDWAYYALFQYFWILVLLPKAVQLLCLGALLCLIWFRSGREKPLDTFTVLQLVFLLIYGVSIVVNTVVGGHETGRIFAAINTWAITAVALGFYHVYQKARLDMVQLGKYAFINLLLLLLFYVVFRLRNGATIDIFGSSLSTTDWVNGQAAMRFLGFLDYSNLVVFCILFFYPMMLHYLGGRWVISGIMTALLFLPIYDTNSRTGLVLYLLVVLAYLLFGLQKNFFVYYRSRKYALLAVAVLAVLGCIVLFANQLGVIIARLVGMREGSNNMRLLIYETSLQTMWSKSPFIGIGIKDMLSGYPLGSHSTYIGVFYKTGIVGGTIYLVSMLFVMGKGVLGRETNRFRTATVLCLIACALLMVLEDIDGANWSVCVFYILLALVQNGLQGSPTDR